MSEGNEMPKWLVENEDGSITVKFDDMKRPPKIDGTQVTSLTLREPSVSDQITADKSAAHNGDREVNIIANLAELAPEAVGRLTLKQYARLQDAYAAFSG